MVVGVNANIAKATFFFVDGHCREIIEAIREVTCVSNCSRNTEVGRTVLLLFYLFGIKKKTKKNRTCNFLR